MKRISAHVCAMDGTMPGAASTDREDQLAGEGAVMHVSPEGEMNMMTSAEDGLYVTEPNLRAEYTPHYAAPDNG